MYVCMYVCIYIYIHTCCFHVSAFVHNAAINRGEGMYLFELLFLFPLDVFPEVKLLDDIVVLALIFLTYN